MVFYQKFIEIDSTRMRRGKGVQGERESFD